MQGGTFFFALLLVIMGGTTHVVGLETTPSPDIGLAEAPPCNSSRDCLSCSDIPGCGWCDVTQECMIGTEFGANHTICVSWFYYGCFSAGNTALCSEHIEDLSCDQTHCDVTKTNYNPDVCEHCRSVEACFDQEENTLCPAWNEIRCPDGLPAQNDSIPHKNVVQVADNVKAIDPADTTLYNCPVIFPPDVGEGATLLVAPNPTGFDVGDIIVSGQAGGVMHTVDNITAAGPYAFVLATAANLEDVITYISFQGTVANVPIEDESTIEHIPEESLLLSALNEDFEDYGTFHAVQEDMGIYKCVGANYVSSMGREWTSTIFVIKQSDFHALSVSEEDIIVGNYSLGWLETVTDITISGEISYVETQLLRCSEMLPDGNRLRLANESNEFATPDLHCIGGDNSPGLMVYDITEEDVNLKIGDIVVGRRSGAFMSKVMTWVDVDGFVFIEASPVSDLSDLTNATTSTRIIRRRRAEIREKFDFCLVEGTKWETTLTDEYENQADDNTEFVSATVTIEPTACFKVDLRLWLEWGWWPTRPVHSVGAVFDGTAELVVKGTAKIAGGIRKEYTETWKEGVIGSPICIPLLPSFPILCLPTRLRYTINATAGVTASISADLTAEASADAAVKFGASWTRASGKIRGHFDSELDFSLTQSASSKSIGTAEFKGAVTPSVSFDLPTAGLPINIGFLRDLKWLLPNWIKKLLKFGGKSTKRSIVTLFSPTLALPVFSSLTAEYCPLPKKVEVKGGIEEAVASVRIGVGPLFVDLSVKVPLPWTKNRVWNYPYCEEKKTSPRTTTTTTTTPQTTRRTFPYGTTTIPYDIITSPYHTTTTTYDITKTHNDTATTPHSTTSTPHRQTVTVTSDNPCIVDLVFLIDGSSKIGRARFEEAKLYIRDVVECLNLTKVGVIQFHCESKWEIILGEYTDNMQLQNAIVADVIFEGGTPSRVGLALRHMKATTPFRDNARKVAVVLTDGRFGGAYAGRAQEARDAGIEIYGVAVGRTAFIQISGLNAITGNPGRVVHWKLVEPCMFAALLCSG